MAVNFLILFHVLKGSHRLSQNLVVGGLCTTSGSNQHETVTHSNSIVKLDNLVEERLNRLQLVSSALLGQFLDKCLLIEFRLLDTREQILNNVLEQRKIVLKELGHIDVSQSSKKQLVLIKSCCEW